MTFSFNQLKNNRILRTPHRYTKVRKARLRVSAIFFVVISFVLLFLEPFKTGESPKILVMGYSLCVLVAYLCIQFIEAIIFMRKQHWVVRDEIAMALIFFVLSAISVYWYDLVVIKEQAYHWHGLLSFTLRVTLPFTIMLLPLVLWLRHYYGRLYELPGQYQVVIKGNVKSDVLEMDQRDILYLKSADNYVEVKHISESGDLKETLIRCTLAQVGDQLPDFLKCHRSYLINPRHLVAVEGNQKKAFLKLAKLDDEIPLSKPHFNTIKARL